jgi:hypothetical protein
MIRFFRTSLLIAAAVTMVGGLELPEAEAGGWGWAKPLNKRGGAFYTSNRNINNSYGVKSKNWRRADNYTSQTYQVPSVRSTFATPSTHVPTYHPPVTVHQGATIMRSVPTAAPPTMPSSRIVHPPASTVQPSMTTQMAIEQWAGR